MISIFLVSTGVICSICCLQVNGQCATPDCKGSSEEIDEILAITSVLWSLSAERNGHRMPSACTECPLGFDYLSEIRQCIKLVLQPLGWDSAREHCTNLALGAQLVAITSEPRQKAVASYLENEFNTCPFGFEFMPESYQCLKLVRQRLSWNGAREACGRLGPGVKMVAITNHAKQAAVTRYLQNEFIKPQSSTCVLPEWLPGGKMVWISGQTRDPNRCGNYVWKPAPGEEIGFTYTNWNRGEPNCGGEHCIIVGSGIGYRWNDGHCHTLTCSVCEI